jgi:hypothetical protein
MVESELIHKQYVTITAVPIVRTDPAQHPVTTMTEPTHFSSAEIVPANPVLQDRHHSWDARLYSTSLDVDLLEQREAALLLFSMTYSLNYHSLLALYHPLAATAELCIST